MDAPVEKLETSSSGQLDVPQETLTPEATKKNSEDSEKKSPVAKKSSSTPAAAKTSKAVTTPKGKGEEPSWEQMLFHLVLFRARNNGSCDVPKKYVVEMEGEAAESSGTSAGDKNNTTKIRLGTWVQIMRRYRRLIDKDIDSYSDKQIEKYAEAASILTPHRIEALESLGFMWENNPRAFQHGTWEQKYSELAKFHSEHGHCEIRKEANTVLYRWCNLQRQLNAEVSGTKVEMGPSARKSCGWAEEVSVDQQKRREGKKTAEYKKVWEKRKAKLDKLGFIWRKRSRTSWEDRFVELKQYKEEHGSCKVPQHYEQNKQLGKWVNRVRTEYKRYSEGVKSAMTQERIAALDGIDFEWTIERQGRRSKLKKEANETVQL
mmetsp:Transcript_9288/g.16170  ORF Transcript_9288/g.16170 Transcript_9288/m.16170 type:complete len:376 (+) Transcript_9288:71-1198(+)